MERDELIRKVEAMRELCGEHDTDGGYNCCGCSTYDLIFDDVLALLKGEPARAAVQAVLANPVTPTPP